MALLCDALLVLDAQGSVTGVRAAAKSLQDLTRAEGCALPDLVFEEDRAAALEAAQRAREEGVGAECTAALALPGGSARYAAIRFVRGADGGSLLAAITDRTAEREKDETIARLRQHDALTGFYNRTYLPALLTQIDTKQSLPLLVIAVDINGMKLANDAFGYAEGDRLILEAATVLKVACPPQGAIARLGGDEFMMLVPRCDAKAGQYIIETITRMCEEEDDAMVPPSLSVGMAVKAHARQDIYSVIREAEEQLSSNRSLNSRRHRTRLIRRLMDYLAEKNFETGKHIVRVKGLALMLGSSLNLSDTRAHPGEKGSAHRKRVGNHQKASRNGLPRGIRAARAHRRIDDRAAPPRAVGRPGVSARAVGRGNTALVPHHIGRGRLR
jgi:diguanylate cyclase (GGDEF)-like protein